VDLTTAIVTAIQALAWPAAVIGGVLLLRREIQALFERISGIKYKDLEISIGKELSMLREALPAPAGEEPRQLPSSPAALKGATPIAKLMDLAARSPRDAIIRGWTTLQDQLVEVAKRKGHDSLSLPLAMPYALGAAWFLHSEKLIPDSVAAAIQNLAAIHAKVISNPDFQPTVDDAQQFLLYANSVWDKLKAIQ
jgi:hypothetical protein